MSRSNRKNGVRRRMRVTGEPYQQALREIEQLLEGQPLIPDAEHTAQQRVESAVLHRLLQGARAQWPGDGRPRFPLFIKAVCPSMAGLRVVVPLGDVPTFAAALAMRRAIGVLPPQADEISIRCPKTNGALHLTAESTAAGLVTMQCSWNDLREAVKADPYVSALSAVSLRFEGTPALRLPPTERAVLSGLLRRIALFVEPTALDWLFAWHEFAMRDRAGQTPRLPASLLSDLTDENVGLPPVHLRALGIDSAPRSPDGKRGSEEADSSTPPRPRRIDLSGTRVPTSVPAREPGVATIPAVASDRYYDERPVAAAGRYNDLAVTVMRLDPAYPVEREQYAMSFPGRWMQSLRRLAQARRGGTVASIPIASLNDAITALVPDCLVARPYAGRSDDDQDWLLAYHPVNPVVLFDVVVAWVRAQPATPDQIEQTLSQLSADDLSWSPVRIGPNVPIEQLIRLIPTEIAATLSRPGASAPFGNLRFLRCPTPTGAELVSWPPEHVEDRTPFSVKIGISVQTVPTSNEPLIYLFFGVHRWMPVRGNLSIGERYSVYLAPNHPYLSGLLHSPHLTTAKIKLSQVQEEGGHNRWLPRWDDGLAGVLEQAGCLKRLPDPERLVAEPLELLRRTDDTAALAFRNGMLSWEKVSDGLSVADRAPLMSWAIGELAPHLRPVEPLPRENCTIYKGLARATNGVTGPDVLRGGIGPRLTVELFTESDATTQHALDGLGERLGTRFPHADELGEAETLLDLGPVTIGVRRMASPRIPANLDGDSRSAQDAVEAQIALVEGLLDQATHPTIALVEIAGQDRRKGRDRHADPKFALRQALLRTGRLSQFVTPVAEPAKPSRAPTGREWADANRQRFSFAIDDVLRQLGVRPAPLPSPAPNTLARRPALLAIWMIRRSSGDARSPRRQVPVAVLADPSGQHVLVRTPDIAWQPLHAALLSIGREHSSADRTYGAKDTLRFIKEATEDAVADFPDTLLLTHAQNLRSTWKFLANRHLVVDTLDFGTDSLHPIIELSGLRHVRLRTPDGGETPECYGINGDETGQATGLWRYLVPRLFGSTTGKPAMHANASKSISKIAPGLRNGKQTTPNPKAEVWNTQFIELFVAGIQDGDRPEHWAALVHDLRSAAPYSRETTVLPWPLHIAQQIEEYLPSPRGAQS